MTSFQVNISDGCLVKPAPLLYEDYKDHIENIIHFCKVRQELSDKVPAQVGGGAAKKVGGGAAKKGFRGVIYIS